MTTYLRDLSRSIGRYGGHSKKEFGFGFLNAQVVSLLGADFWLAKIGCKHHMLEDLKQYNFYVNISKHNPLHCLPCPMSTN